MKCTIVFLVVLLVPLAAHAKISKPVWQTIQEAYQPAEWNEGLRTAYVEPDLSKFRNYVVVQVSGLAAERAQRFIAWADYDYRGVTIDAAKGEVKNRRGKAYTYLQPGDVMAIAKLDKLGDSVYVGLISPEVYKPANREKDKKFSRVTDTVRIKLPKVVVRGDDPTEALAMMAQYLKPFSNIQSAQRFAATQ